RVEDQQELAAGETDGPAELLRGHPGDAAALARGQEAAARDDVEVVLRLALDVDLARPGLRLPQRPERDAARDVRARPRHLEDHRAGVPAGFRVAAPVLGEEAGERRAFGEHGVLPGSVASSLCSPEEPRPSPSSGARWGIRVRASPVPARRARARPAAGWTGSAPAG